MTDDLVKRLRDSCYLAFDDGTNDYGAADEAADRIEKLEAALREIDAVKYYGMEGAEIECKEMHEIARKALEGKDD